MSIRIPKRWQDWAYGLVGGCIGGGAGSAGTWFGMTAAKSIGIDVPTLNLKSLGVIFLVGVLTHAFAYLQKSPLPPPATGNTDFFTKPPVTPDQNKT